MLRPWNSLQCGFVVVLLICGTCALAHEEPNEHLVPVGVAQVDISPTEPVRLAGYASRETETDEIAMPIWAKAITIGAENEGGMSVLVMVENCGCSDEITEPVAAAVRKRLGIARERLVIASTHTHSAPWLDGYLPNQSKEPIPADQRARLTRYSERLKTELVALIERAVEARKPSRIDWSEGTVAFAANRRVIKDGVWTGFGVAPQGPVDHSLPMLRVTGPEGQLQAVVVNYACHCTTLTGRHNCVHGDWAGCAQQAIQQAHPGATAMVVVGCGGDANPEPRESIEAAEEHGASVAREVERLLAGDFQPLNFPLEARSETVRLPYGDIPTREQLTENLQGLWSTANIARQYLARLDRGESIPTGLDYTITTWRFGNSLAMVFLPGEVVVDYALRLREEITGVPLWITAYANDVPCYIPSKRLIAEGGYEVDRSMEFYGHPTRLAPKTEDIIVEAVHELVGDH